MDNVPDSGDLEQTPLPRLLLDLYRVGFDGTLRLTQERREKSFRFQAGLPITAESNRVGETLGLQLVDAGTISRSDYTQVVEQVEKRGCREGTALLALGLIDPKGLFRALKEQVRRRIVECFGWPRGRFQIDRGQAAAAEAQPFRADLYALLQEGIESHWSAERILADLAGRANLFPTRAARAARVEARLASDAGLQAFLGSLDGFQPFWKALQRASTPRAMAAVWVLDAAGAIDYESAPRTSANQPTTREVPEIEILVESAERSTQTAGTEEREIQTARVRSPEAEALQREIVSKCDHLEKLSHYDLLGIELTANARDIKKAYLVAAKVYHPDALARLDVESETRDRANALFAAIGGAYSVLSNPSQRAEYDASLRDDQPEIDTERLANAETLYRKGEILMRAGNFKGAVEFFRPAVQLWPEEAAYQAGLGWALFKQMPSEAEAAREHLTQATELDATDAQHWFRLSLVLRAISDDDGASQALERARQIDPSVA